MSKAKYTNKLPKHCEGCGRKIVWGKPVRTREFDIITGDLKDEYDYTGACPNRMRFNLGISKHVKYEVHEGMSILGTPHRSIWRVH